jgi:hypothetical protein
VLTTEINKHASARAFSKTNDHFTSKVSNQPVILFLTSAAKTRKQASLLNQIDNETRHGIMHHHGKTTQKRRQR